MNTNDPRVDALIRRLDVPHEPSDAVVEGTFAAISTTAEQTRRRERRRSWRLLDRLGRRLGVGTSRARPARQRALILVLAAVGLALVAWMTLLVAGQRPPAWRPEHVVFGRFNGTAGAWDILAMRVDGTDERPLLAGAHDLTRVSHDGQLIASATIGDLVFPTIYTPAGAKLLELHADPTLNLGAMAWSRDDEWLAFEAWDETDPTRDGVYVLRANGSGLRRVTSEPGIPGDFSPDDATLLVIREGVGLFAVNLDGTDERQIGSMTVDAAGFYPDGRAVYATAAGRLWHIDLESGAPTMIPMPAGQAGTPRISPDGRRFVLTLLEPGGGSRGIWSVSVDGSRPAKLVDVPGINEAFPDWLP